MDGQNCNSVPEFGPPAANFAFLDENFGQKGDFLTIF